MRKIILTLIIVGSVFLQADTSLAQSKLYFGTGISLNQLNYYTDNSQLGGTVLLGYDFTKSFGLEARYGMSFTNTNSIDTRQNMSFNGKYQYELSRDTNIYVLLGMSKVEIETPSLFVDESSISGVIGVNYKLSPSVSFYTDYSYVSKDISQVNIGLKYFISKHRTDYREKEVEDQRLKELEEEEAKRMKAEEEKAKIKSRLKIKLLHANDFAKPITVYLFEISSIENFRRLDYWELVEDAEYSSIVRSTREVLEPGKLSTLEFTLDDATSHYAVIASLSDVDTENLDKWQYIKKINKHEITRINVMINTKTIVGIHE